MALLWTFRGSTAVRVRDEGVLSGVEGACAMAGGLFCNCLSFAEEICSFMMLERCDMLSIGGLLEIRA